MKIILSRKGFDSSTGKNASPIFDNNIMISLPIPDDSANINYKELYNKRYGNYYKLLKKIAPKKEFTTCHLDPDINKNIYARDRGWRGLFGQSDKAQSHLESQEVRAGDLFLFYGWFKHVKEIGDKIEYAEDKEYCDGKHVIFGYMQIDKIIPINYRIKIQNSSPISGKSDIKWPKWMKYHPHISEEGRDEKINCIYVASKTLSWNNKIPGFGTFDYSNKLVLSAPREASRTTWELNSCFKDKVLSWNGGRRVGNDRFFSISDRGQEFVVDATPDIETWAKSLIIGGLNV
jgi:hypothetical protein